MKFQSFCCPFLAFALLFVPDHGLLSSLARASSAPMAAHSHFAAKAPDANIAARLALPAIRGAGITVEFDAQLHTRIGAQFPGESILPIGPFSTSEKLASDNSVWENFKRTDWHCSTVHDALGAGKMLVVAGRQGAWIKHVTVTVYDAFPDVAVFDVAYTNAGPTALKTAGWTNGALVVTAAPSSGAPAFWSYQSGSYESRP